MRRFLFFFCCFCLPIFGWEQTQNKIDSIQALLKNEIQDSTRYKYLLTLGKYYDRKSNIDSSSFYVTEAIKVAKNSNDPKKEVTGYITLGNAYLNTYNYEQAFRWYSKADSVCELVTPLKNSKLHGRALNFMGYAVRLTHDYDKAGSYYNKAKSIYEGLAYEFGIQEVNVALGQLLMNKEDYAQALSLFNEAVAYHKNNGKKNPYTYAVICRGYLLVKMKAFDKAEQDYLTYYEEAIKTENKTKQLRSLSYLGYFYLEKLDLSKSVAYYSSGLEMAKEEQNFFMQEEMQKGLIDAYKKMGNSKLLSATYDEYIVTRNILDSINKQSEIYKLETQYQTQQKEQEINLLKAENALVENQKANQRNLLLAGIGLVFLAGLFFYFQNKNKQKVTRKLQELDRAKNEFIANITHEFRTPLTLVSGPTQKLKQSNNLSTEDQVAVAAIQENSDRLIKLVDQLLEISTIESGNLKLAVSENQLFSFIGSLCQSFQSLAKEKGIDYDFTIQSSNTLYYYDQDKIEKIILNLISNAIKYVAPENPKIVIKASIIEEHLHFEVTNTITENKHDNLNKYFERFYQGDPHREGVGLGLALVKELVQLHKGTIEFIPLEAQKIKIQFEIPVTQNHFNTDEIIFETVAETPNNKEIDKTLEVPVLLIIDDSDDIRAFIVNLFKDRFQVIQASDGMTGFKEAVKTIPDIIISDVMMPGLDGNQLIQKLKEDEHTSHIPIILLTAKVSKESKIKSTQIGADDYITKPFDIGLLEAKINQLLSNRKRLQERYSQEVILKPKDIAVTSADQRFLEKIQKILDEQLTNPEFTTEKFGAAVGMSRMQFYRKLKAITGLSGTEFIRSQRLQLAATLLQKNEISITEIGYTVGFNDPSYFSKCFKETYGYTPKEYINKS